MVIQFTHTRNSDLTVKNNNRVQCDVQDYFSILQAFKASKSKKVPQNSVIIDIVEGLSKASLLSSRLYADREKRGGRKSASQGSRPSDFVHLYKYTSATERTRIKMRLYHRDIARGLNRHDILHIDSTRRRRAVGISIFVIYTSSAYRGIRVPPASNRDQVSNVSKSLKNDSRPCPPPRLIGNQSKNGLCGHAGGREQTRTPVRLVNRSTGYGGGVYGRAVERSTLASGH